MEKPYAFWWVLTPLAKYYDRFWFIAICIIVAGRLLVMFLLKKNVPNLFPNQWEQANRLLKRSIFSLAFRSNAKALAVIAS